MLDFLRSLAPRQAHALRAAAPLRTTASVAPDACSDADALRADPDVDAIPTEAPAAVMSSTRVPRAGDAANGISPSRPGGDRADQHSRALSATADEGPISARPMVNTVLATVNAASTARPATSHEADATHFRPLHASGATPLSSDLQPIFQSAKAEDVRRDATPAVPVAPLSAATVALLVSDAATAAPRAIHISIDRIDVRTARAHAPAPNAQARQRATPDPQSLRDYLRGKPSP